MDHIRGHISDSLSEKCTVLIDTKQLVVKVEMLTVNELWSRFS